AVIERRRRSGLREFIRQITRPAPVRYNPARGSVMKPNIVKSLLPAVAAAFLALSLTGAAQHGTTGGEWRHYGGDAGGTKYSPLDQINASNVSKLQIAWRWKTSSLGGPIDSNWEVTPLMIGNTV